MDADNSEIKRVILLTTRLANAGGAERLILEIAKYLKRDGVETHVLTFELNNKALFNEAYDVNIEQIGYKTESKLSLLGAVQQIANIFILRRKIRKIRPDIIISLTSFFSYFATLFSSFSYVIHIHGTIFWLPTDLLKYAFIHRKVFNEILDSNRGHREFISPHPPKMNLVKRMLVEAHAYTAYISIRKAKEIFVLSNRMKWEVYKLYGKNAIVLKGAFPSQIFHHKPRQNIKVKLGLEDKRIILNVNRLVIMKRVDLLIKAFKQISEEFNDLVLIIGGTGPEEKNLKALAKELNMQDRVKFVGYIKEEELLDYYISCDVFVHPEWADFDIAPYEALALHRKVVWSSEMETDEYLKDCKLIFVANPTVDDLAKVIKKALMTEVAEKKDLQEYTWETYCERLMKVIDHSL